MSLYRYSNEHDYPSFKGYREEKKEEENFRGCHYGEDKKDDWKYKKEKKDDCYKDCGGDSARTLKKILYLLEELNIHDLHILDQIIERALCIRSKKVY